MKQDNWDLTEQAPAEEENFQPFRKVLTEEDREMMKDRREELHKRIFNQDHKKLFRNAYCFKAGYDFSSLKPYCENLVMVTDGLSDHIDNSRRNLEEGLADYDSDRDVIVLAGRTFDHLLAGQIVTQKVLQKTKPYQSYAIAMYLNPNYHFYEMYLDPSIPSHRITSK